MALHVNESIYDIEIMSNYPKSKFLLLLKFFLYNLNDTFLYYFFFSVEISPMMWGLFIMYR